MKTLLAFVYGKQKRSAATGLQLQGEGWLAAVQRILFCLIGATRRHEELDRGKCAASHSFPPPVPFVMIPPRRNNFFR